MATFIYSAAKKTGEIVKGTREAENEQALVRMLKQEELFLLELREEDKKQMSQPLAAQLMRLAARFQPIPLVEKITFTRNLAVMIRAGLSLPRALETIAEQSPNAKFRQILEQVKQSVVKGESFSQSLARHESVFGELFTNIVDVGETSGKLGTVLMLLSNQMKKDHDLRRRVFGALIYPAIVIFVLFVIAALMMIYVVPTLSETLKGLGVSLPVSTQIIIGTSDFISSHASLLGIGISLLVFLFWRALKTKQGKSLFDRAILYAPPFGTLVRRLNMARFSRILAYLVTAGVPIVRSLEITSRVLGNTVYREAVFASSQNIQKGKPLNELLREHPRLFDPMVVQMVKAGEESGNVSRMLLRIASFFEEEVASTTQNLSQIIEPVLIIVIGALVGFFAISVLQPIYGSLGNIR